MKNTHKYLIFGALLSSLAFQSFQCSSPEYTGAKMAYQQKDYKKAADGLEKEVAKNPANGEAWYLLADCQLKQNDYQKAAKSILEAQKRATADPLKTRVADQLFFTWAEVYNKGTNLYNDFTSSNKSGDISDLKTYLELALSLKPENAEPWALLGNALEMKGDTAGAIKAYESYQAQIMPVIKFMGEKNLNLASSREEALSAIGKPQQTKAFPDNNKGDSIIVDKIAGDGREIYLSSVKKAGGRAMIEGMRLNLPANWLNAEKERYYAMNTRPMVNMAFLHYGQKSYSQAVSVIDQVLAISPSEEDLASLKIQIYEEQGKTNEVLQQLEEATKRNPNNKITLEQYARVLARQKQYDKAIGYYEKALAVDPKFEMAIFNIGACYVNKAAEVIDEENKKVDANSKYKPDETRFYPLLNKAADYFNQYRSIPQQKDNFGVLQQLADIYLITRQNDKFKQIVADLETIESANANNAAYFEYMGKVFAKQGQKDKADRMFKRSDQLKK
jgi:tetratricopeptide (TPR) repeat protein